MMMTTITEYSQVLKAVTAQAYHKRRYACECALDVTDDVWRLIVE